MRKNTTLARRGTKLSLAVAGVVAAIAAASPATAAVTGSIVASGLNSPGGTVQLGTHQWIADHVSGFCRLDPNPATGKLAINTATCNTAALSPGQPAFDPATNSVYVPDNSTKGTGVYRLTFNPTTETVRTSALLGSNVIAAGAKPTATALSADGTALYVGSIRSGNIVKITNPATALAGQVIGRTSDGRGASGLAIANHSDGTLGSSLYLAEGGGVSELDLATGGVATLTGIVPQTVVGGKAIAWETLDVVAASPDVLYVAKWAPHDFGPKVTIAQYTLSTGTGIDYSTTYTAPDGKPQPWTTVTDLTLNPAGGLFVSHDPTNGGTNGSLLSKTA
jgi:hypothetical protein